MARLPNARLTTWPGEGHLAFIAHIDDVLADIAAKISCCLTDASSGDRLPLHNDERRRDRGHADEYHRVSPGSRAVLRVADGVDTAAGDDRVAEIRGRRNDTMIAVETRSWTSTARRRASRVVLLILVPQPAGRRSSVRISSTSSGRQRSARPTATIHSSTGRRSRRSGVPEARQRGGDRAEPGRPPTSAADMMSTTASAMKRAASPERAEADRHRTEVHDRWCGGQRIDRETEQQQQVRGRAGGAGRRRAGCAPTRSPRSTSPASTPSVNHDGESEAVSANSAARMSLVPAHSRCTNESPGTSRRNVISGSRRRARSGFGGRRRGSRGRHERFPSAMSCSSARPGPS